MAGLNKEIWLAELKEQMMEDDSFLKESVDYSAFVENDKINLAEAGADPDVLINNSTFPVPTIERTDNAITLELDVLDTTNTRLKNAEKAELAYDKMQSLVMGHRRALKKHKVLRSLYNFSPSADGVHTPIIPATGPNNGSGVKRLSYEDLHRMEARVADMTDVDGEGWILALNSAHREDLRNEDAKLFKRMFDDNQFGIFKIYTIPNKNMPQVLRADGTKLPFGTAGSATSTICSILWNKDEVMRAEGTLDFFEKLRDPDYRADIIGYQQRFLARDIRNKGLGLIYSAAV